MFQISRLPRNGANADFSLTTTVLGSTADIDSTAPKGAGYADCLSPRMRSRLNTTSEAVIGEPSEKRASRRWKVYVSPSAEMSQLSASPGSSAPVDGLRSKRRE